jgi:hypothetical protein
VTGDATDPSQPAREPLLARIRRIAGWQMILVVALFALALLRFGAGQSASATLEGVVGQDGRIVAQQVLGEVHALLVERGDAFQLLMAYRIQDGWVALHIRQPPSAAELAVEQSKGHDPVPAFTAVYGRLRVAAPGAGSSVRIAWNDGSKEVPLVDGAFLSVRQGRYSVGEVSLLGPGGVIIRSLAT